MAGKSGKSGRQGREARKVVSLGFSASHERPQPPEHLTKAQSMEWAAVVDACPADWFPRETHGTLESHYRHTVAEREIDAMVQNVMTSGLEPGEIVGALDKALQDA